MIERGRNKLIKDNVLGYIYINEYYFKIIDTPHFQRLKYIQQTSYTSLYPSATHNRFVHSLGVFFLASKVIKNLWQNMDDDIPNSVKKDDVEYTLKIAALLHDVGHAPFSHTAENFFEQKEFDSDPRLENYEYLKSHSKNSEVDFSYLDASLIDALITVYGKDNLSAKSFLTDFSECITNIKRSSPKPHEKMSALLGITQLKKQIDEVAGIITKNKISFNADLFVRCITGVQYNMQDNEKKETNSFYNAIISLLNSDVIDVDKLDYILRDTYMTGFENTSIDTERLISSFTMYKHKDVYQLGYKKTALSVVENVIMANDASKHWVQNHPTVLYDTYITQVCVSTAFKILGSDEILKRYFSCEALSPDGITIEGIGDIFLESDSDLIHVFKLARGKALKEEKHIFDEFFSRQARKHPLWKSEAEYKTQFYPSKADSESQKERKNAIINGIKAIKETKDSFGVGIYYFNSDVWEKITTNKIKLAHAGKKFVEILNNYFSKNNKDFDIVILPISGFTSGLYKLENASIKIKMPDFAKKENEQLYYQYSELNTVKPKETAEELFYLYVNKDSEIDTKDLISYLLNQANFRN